MKSNNKNTIFDTLLLLYGEEGDEVFPRVLDLIDRFKQRDPGNRKKGLDEKDAILITYGDQFYKESEKPLKTLKTFSDTFLKEVVSGIHILPFYPYSSDDGFSVVDYTSVNPTLGNWTDVEALSDNFRLMFDFVGNHISSQSEWFLNYLKGVEEYRNYFLEVEKDSNLSEVVRPRDLPLLHEFKTSRGRKLLWTTFSGDQIDLNYACPEVLLKMIEVFLFYIEKRAELVRFDAVQFTWKEIGTHCIHHPKTHAWVQLMNAIVEEAAPEVLIITETAVPHAYNLSYFGNGMNETNLIYNFTLPPLLLYCFAKEDASILSTWASSLEYISDTATYFNLLACHDGVGVNAIRDVLPEEEVIWLSERMVERGGCISYFNKSDGSKAPYELNISYINGLSLPGDTIEIKTRKLLNAFSIAFSLIGIPGIYVHSIIGSENWEEGVQKSGIKRRINREKCELTSLCNELETPGTLRNRVYEGMKLLLMVRRRFSCFHPNAEQKILSLGSAVFGVYRKKNEEVITIHNLTASEQYVTIDISQLQLPITGWRGSIHDSVVHNRKTTVSIVLPPFGYEWLHPCY